MVRGETLRTTASQFFEEMPEEVFETLDLTGGDDDEPGSLGYRDEAGYARRPVSRFGNRHEEAITEHKKNELLSGEFRAGQLVKHPQFGMGRIESISPAGSMTKVDVRFTGGTKKTLILQYARLEKIDT
jgi:DNA helicase-2/ATP-dependent DNA helicase PcrA